MTGTNNQNFYLDQKVLVYVKPKTGAIFFWIQIKSSSFLLSLFFLKTYKMICHLMWLYKGGFASTSRIFQRLCIIFNSPKSRAYIFDFNITKFFNKRQIYGKCFFSPIDAHHRVSVHTTETSSCSFHPQDLPSSILPR